MGAKITLAAALLAGVAWAANAGEPAVFDVATSQLRMPVLQIDQTTRFRDVVIQLINPGQLVLDDPAVGSEISFSTTGNVLRLPQLSLGGALYPRVSLANPGFVLVSFGDIVVDAGQQGQYQLDIRVTAAASVSVPPITLANVPKPANQDQFCNDPALRETITQNAGGYAGTWTMTGCSFTGSSGRIDMVLNVSGFALPYSATYTYH